MELLDFATLKFIWWLLVGVLLVGFAVMDGHDMGVATLLPFVGKTDSERRIVVNSVGVHWEGNQVWFITAGGAIFAAWPLIYAAAFSGFYWAMLAVLWALFFRPVGFKYRSMMSSTKWRYSWDWGLFAGSFVPPVIFGVAFGNLLIGVPFHLDDIMRPHYEGTFWALLNPFAIVCGLVSSAMITLQGAAYLMHRTEAPICYRAQMAVYICAGAGIVLFTIAGIWLYFGYEGYKIVEGSLNVQAMPNPLDKEVELVAGAWFYNYGRYPLLLLVPMLGYLGFAGAAMMAKMERTIWTFVFSSLAIAGVIGTAGVSMFPFLMPSSSNPVSSLTMWDSTSSHLTLFVMFIVALIFVPIVLSYTAWAYWKMRGKITEKYISDNEHSAY